MQLTVQMLSRYREYPHQFCVLAQRIDLNIREQIGVNFASSMKKDTDYQVLVVPSYSPRVDSDRALIHSERQRDHIFLCLNYASSFQHHLRRPSPLHQQCPVIHLQ